jgi:hypothetical protein
MAQGAANTFEEGFHEEDETIINEWMARIACFAFFVCEKSADQPVLERVLIVKGAEHHLWFKQLGIFSQGHR